MLTARLALALTNAQVVVQALIWLPVFVLPMLISPSVRKVAVTAFLMVLVLNVKLGISSIRRWLSANLAEAVACTVLMATLVCCVKKTLNFKATVHAWLFQSMPIALCHSGYFLDNNSNCSSCLPNCEVCSDQLTCTSCLKNFDLNGDKTICSASINITPCPGNCTSCSDSLTCDICKSGFFLNLDDSSCLPCPSNCASCSDSNTCLYCISNHSLVNGNCVPAELSWSAVSGCPQFCSPFACSNSTCTQCIEGYFLASAKECLTCPQNCLFCSNATFCTQCNEFSSLVDGSCNPNIQSITQSMAPTGTAPTAGCPPNCAQCSNPYTCSVCALSFALDPVDGKCAKCPLNCYKCNDKNTCDVCVPGYFPNGNGVCTPCTPNCQSCQSNSSCLVSCPSNCLDCSSGNTCNQCATGFALKNGACQRIVCAEETCLECSDNSTCTRCAVGFYLNSASCSACPTNCTSCSDGVTCTGCIDGYNLALNGTCLLACSNVLKNCERCSGIQFTCSSCSSGFELISIHNNLTICSVSGS